MRAIVAERLSDVVRSIPRSPIVGWMILYVVDSVNFLPVAEAKSLIRMISVFAGVLKINKKMMRIQARFPFSEVIRVLRPKGRERTVE
jgi:hypothetical protein